MCSSRTDHVYLHTAYKRCSFPVRGERTGAVFCVSVACPQRRLLRRPQRLLCLLPLFVADCTAQCVMERDIDITMVRPAVGIQEYKTGVA